MGRAALLLGLLLCGGCATGVPEPQSPFIPPPLVPEIRQEALAVAPPSDIRVTGIRFSGAVEDFGAAVDRLLVLTVPPGDEDMARALDLFSWALAWAPEGDRVGASVAAAEMREDAEEMRVFWPRGAPPVRDAYARGLGVGVENLLALARGPYGDVKNVRERADELEAAYEVLAAQRAMIEYGASLEVLRHAGFVLDAILEVQSVNVSVERGQRNRKGARSAREE